MIDVNYISASDFCDSVRDGTHDTPKQTNSGYKLVTSKHIKNGQINSNEGYFISEKDFHKINERSLVEQWDVLMSMIGTIGEAAIVKERPDYAIKNVALFKCGDEQKAKWLYYYLCSPDGKGQLFGNQKGASQQFISLTQLRNLQIPVRDNTNMKKITEILSVYDDLIENNKKQIKLLEEAAMRLYKEWFVNLRFLGYETVEIVDGLPKGWALAKTKEFMKFKYGKALKANDRKFGEYPVYGSSGVVGYHNDYLVKGPVIIVGRKGNVGSVYLSYSNAYPIDTVYYIESDISTLYAYFNLMTRTFNNNDSAVPGLNRDYAESMDMMCPDNDLLNEFEEKASIFLELKNNLLSQIDLLQQARDSLLPKLISGEIEV